MAQLGIREYDAKSLWAQHSWLPYRAWMVDETTNFDTLLQELTTSEIKFFVVKPDQLFGKRGKHWLIGLALDAHWVVEWVRERMGTTMTISERSGTLTSFLVEAYVAHTDEYYLSFETTREADLVNFSLSGGIDIEDNRDSVQSLKVSVLDDISDEALEHLTADIYDSRIKSSIVNLVRNMFVFFRRYGFVYIECNPFTIVQGEVQLLDMVAKVDDCAHIRVGSARDTITRVKPFGTHVDPVESIVHDMDEKTAASLKLHVLNPNGRLWMILGGGGASVILIDSLWEMWLAEQVANYGELSGNPDTDSNREYSRLIIQHMLRSSATNKYLIIAGGIANFTYIDSLFIWVCDAIKDCAQDIKEQGIRLLVRRWWLNDAKGLAMVGRICKDYGIPVITADGDVYMTDVLHDIH